MRQKFSDVFDSPRLLQLIVLTRKIDVALFFLKSFEMCDEGMYK